MPPPTADTGLDNLERFIEAITAATVELQSSTDALQQRTGQVSGFEDGIGEALGGYADDLDRLQDELAGEHQEAHASVEGLAGVAQTGEQELAAAVTSLEQGESQFGGRMTAAAADWNQDLSALTEGGFRPLDTELDRVHQDAQTSGEETDAAFDAFEAALPPIQSGVESLGAETGGKLEALHTALEGTEATELETAASECVSGLTGLEQRIETECTSISSETETLYQAWLAALQGEGQELQATFGTLMTNSTQVVGDISRDQVEGPFDAALEGYLQPLDTELDDVESLFSTEAATVAELEPMIEDVEIAGSVAPRIHDALESMDIDAP